MERFPGRVFLIALCLSLAATRLQAGDKPVAYGGREVVVSGATPVDTGTPATPVTNESSLRTANDRLAAADTDSADAGDASAPDSSGSPAVAASADSSTAVANGPRAVGDQDLITMNFQNVDLPVLAKFISEITGKNFVLDENVRGRVSIISPTRVTPEQAYSIFQSVLQVKGFTTVQAGSIIKMPPARHEVRMQSDWRMELTFPVRFEKVRQSCVSKRSERAPTGLITFPSSETRRRTGMTLALLVTTIVLSSG